VFAGQGFTEWAREQASVPARRRTDEPDVFERLYESD
jgi:hypothetical protein